MKEMADSLIKKNKALFLFAVADPDPGRSNHPKPFHN